MKCDGYIYGWAEQDWISSFTFVDAFSHNPNINNFTKHGVGCTPNEIWGDHFRTNHVGKSEAGDGEAHPYWQKPREESVIQREPTHKQETNS